MGKLTKNQKLAAEKIEAGKILPALSWVLALNCLQNSMILIPLEPKAGPTGGDGFAAPPLICNHYLLRR